MSYLKSLTIKHFKGFSDERNEITFAIPASKKGSGLTVIVGQNNAGKSTVFDALLKLRDDKRLSQSERWDEQSIEIRLQDFEGKQKLITNISGGNQIRITGESSLGTKDFDYISPRRYWSHKFSSGEMDFKSYSSSMFSHGRQYTTDDYLPRLLGNINKNVDGKNKFNNLMKQVLSNFSDWTIDSADESSGDYVKYTTIHGKVHHAGLLGDGMISLFRVISTLCNTEKGRILIIDEPELSLHPQAQRKLADLIAQKSLDQQVILSTHSPYFIRGDDIQNGAQIVRLQKINDKNCEVYRLDKGKDYYGLISSNEDWHKPHLFDVVAKEVFFAENVVFVEGQEDMGLISKYISDNDVQTNFEIFGYGSGGSGNIKHFLEMAKDLGVNAGAIFDGNKNEEKEQCQRRFPNYLIQQIAKDDIRDKDGKEGIFGSDGKIKPNEEASFKSVINAFIEHFKPTL